jgi:hypothetical protein
VKKAVNTEFSKYDSCSNSHFNFQLLVQNISFVYNADVLLVSTSKNLKQPTLRFYADVYRRMCTRKFREGKFELVQTLKAHGGIEV